MLSLFYLKKMRKGIFTNKKVFLIGPAAYIKDMKYDVTDYDLVCVVNNMFPLSDFLRNIGITRADVVFLANGVIESKIHQFYVNDFKWLRIRKEGLKFIPEELKEKICMMNMQGFLKLKTGKVLNRGLRAMWDIIKDRPKELYVSGFTFYQDEPYYKGYTSDKYLIFHRENKGNFEDGHQQEPQIKFFLKYIFSLPFMKYDDYFLTLVEKLKQQYPDYENTI